MHMIRMTRLWHKSRTPNLRSDYHHHGVRYHHFHNTLKSQFIMAPLRLRHPKGVTTLQIDLDTATVSDLQQAIFSETEISPSRQDRKRHSSDFKIYQVEYLRFFSTLIPSSTSTSSMHLPLLMYYGDGVYSQGGISTSSSHHRPRVTCRKSRTKAWGTDYCDGETFCISTNSVVR